MSEVDHASSPVTVVITTCNDSEWLPQAIQSVLAQTHPADEIIVVDDGSLEDPGPSLASWPNVTLIRQTNMGLAAARNSGLKHARSNFILFLDADDRLEPIAIQAGLACMEKNPDASFVYGGFRITNGDRSKFGPGLFQPMGPRPFRDLLRGNTIKMHATVLYRRDRLLEIGGFDPSLRRCEDYDLYLRIARSGKPIGSHPGIVAEYRWHECNMSHNRAAMRAAVLAVHERHEKFARLDPADYAAWREGRRHWKRYYRRGLGLRWRLRALARHFRQGTAKALLSQTLDRLRVRTLRWG